MNIWYTAYEGDITVATADKISISEVRNIQFSGETVSVMDIRYTYASHTSATRIIFNHELSDLKCVNSNIKLNINNQKKTHPTYIDIDEILISIAEQFPGIGWRYVNI